MSERLTIKVYRTAAYRTVEKAGKQAIELYMVDVADVIEPPKSKPKIRLSNETRMGLFHDLAEWVGLGELSMDEAKQMGGDAE